MDNRWFGNAFQIFEAADENDLEVAMVVLRVEHILAPRSFFVTLALCLFLTCQKLCHALDAHDDCTTLDCDLSTLIEDRTAFLPRSARFHHTLKSVVQA